MQIKYWALCLAVLTLLSSIAKAGDIKGMVTSKGVRDSRNTVVYVERVEGEFMPPDSALMMDQRDMIFIPHILPVVKGTTVDFRNSDNVLHNVFSPDKCTTKFNLGTWPKGEVRSFTFEDEGCFAVVLCNVHPEMEAFVLSLQNPYFFVTDKDGAFIISDLPVGSYTLVAWHEKLKSASQTVEVTETGEVIIDFALSR